MEDVDNSTTVALSPVIHKQQPEAKNVHSRVQDLYLPISKPQSYKSLQMVEDNNDHKITRNISCPEPLLPCVQKPLEASSVANASAWPPPSVVLANSTEPRDGVQQDMDSSESKEIDKRLQGVSESRDQSHDYQAIAGINGSQDKAQSIHHKLTLLKNVD